MTTEAPKRAARRAGSRRTARNFRERRCTASQVFSFEVEIFSHLCESIDTPRALACYMLAQSSEWAQYLSLSTPDPSLSTFADDYLVSEMMTKNPRLPLNVDRRAVALEKFRESENLCAQTNSRWSSYYSLPSKHSKELDRISRVQRILEVALGPLSRGKLSFAERNFRFGPGATSAVSGSDVLLSKKYAVPTWDATPRLTPFVPFMKGQAVGDVNVVHYSVVTTVPKNAKTDRTICIEPHANIYYQLGVGALLRDRLCRLGLEPNNQERNRMMASRSVKCGYATIDLSMASDTIASQVVFRLFPDDWFHLLYLGRTDSVNLDGEILHLQKFSSMGNGYTWELESLIFYAIARSLTDKEIGVFGDDLVVPSEIVDDLFEALNFFGFKANPRKSFWQGDFRESCGTDWWRGLDVRPFFLRKDHREIRDLRHYAVQVANAIRWYSHRRGGRSFCDRRFLRSWLLAKKRSGELQATRSSFGYGDDGLIVNFDEASPSRLRRGLQGWRGVVCKARALPSFSTSSLGAYLAALDRGGGDFSRNEEFVRGRTLPLRYEEVPVFDWYDLGPWL